jgi:hypothetical protein
LMRAWDGNKNGPPLTFVAPLKLWNKSLLLSVMQWVLSQHFEDNHYNSWVGPHWELLSNDRLCSEVECTPLAGTRITIVFSLSPELHSIYLVLGYSNRSIDRFQLLLSCIEVVQDFVKAYPLTSSACTASPLNYSQMILSLHEPPNLLSNNVPPPPIHQ